jgi:hypothetical protein
MAIHAFLKALGVPDAEIPAPTGARMDKLVETLGRKGRVMIAVDEAHHVSGVAADFGISPSAVTTVSDRTAGAALARHYAMALLRVAGCWKARPWPA